MEHQKIKIFCDNNVEKNIYAIIIFLISNLSSAVQIERKAYAFSLVCFER
jgi:hypothetical protein